jgi:hypothetical protein
MSNSPFDGLSINNPHYDLASTDQEADDKEVLQAAIKEEIKDSNQDLLQELVRQFHLTDTTVLANLRKAFAFKLFRLIKAWLAGAAIFLVFVTVQNQTIGALLALSIFFGICASLLNDKVFEFRTMARLREDKSRADKKTNPFCQKNAIKNLGFHLPYIPMVLSGSCFTYAMSLLLPCWWDLACIIDLKSSKSFTVIKADNAVVITLITTTTATVIGLFIIAARWLFKMPNEDAGKKAHEI